jgi:hypothetical protein
MSLFAKPIVAAIALLFTTVSFAETPYDLGKEVSRIRSFVSTELNAGNCSDRLKDLNDRVERVLPQEFLLKKAKSDAKEIIKSLFLTRLALAENLRRMSKSESLSHECISNVRRSFRIGRFVEEYLAKMAGFDQEVNVLEGEEPYLLVNPKYSSFKIQTGDILISRGNAIVSAAIARSGDDDGHFSHAALAYVDDATQKVYVIESHVEIGLDVAPIEEKYIHDGKMRIVVYRAKDKKLAAAAAKWAYDLGTQAIKKGNPIPYDFGMDLSDESHLFCTEVPYAAYKAASGGRFLIGDQYLTSFSPKNQNFLKGIGVLVDRTLSPSDIEFDSKLELVAEWRDLSGMDMANRKDAVMFKVFEWMEQRGYRFNLTRTVPMSYISVFVRRFPVLGNLVLGNVMSVDVTPRTVQTMMVMDLIGDKLLDDLIVAYKEHGARTGFDMTFPEMLASLDKILLQDLEREHLLAAWKKKNVGVYDDTFPQPADRPEDPHFVQYFVHP